MYFPQNIVKNRRDWTRKCTEGWVPSFRSIPVQSSSAFTSRTELENQRGDGRAEDDSAPERDPPPFGRRRGYVPPLPRPPAGVALNHIWRSIRNQRGRSARRTPNSNMHHPRFPPKLLRRFEPAHILSINFVFVKQASLVI